MVSGSTTTDREVKNRRCQALTVIHGVTLLIPNVMHGTLDPKQDALKSLRAEYLP